MSLILLFPSSGIATQTLSPSGISSTVSFGTTKIVLYVVPTGKASTVAFGSSTIKLYIVPSAIVSTITIGALRVVLYIKPSEIVSTVTFGTTQLGNKQTVSPIAISSTVAIGTAKLNLIIYPTARLTTLAFGLPKINLKIFPSGISSTTSLGIAKIVLIVKPNGISSNVVFGNPIISTGAVYIVPVRISSTLTFGLPKLISSTQLMYPSAIASGVSFGVVDIFHSIWGDPRMPYATPEHFERILEGFGTAYYGTQSNNGTGTVEVNVSQFWSDIYSSWNTINLKLDGIDRIPVVPVGTQSNGSFNQYLVDWNVFDTIYTKLRSRHLFQYGDNLPEWIKEFGTRSDNIEKMIRDGVVTFETDTTNKGIGYPIRVYGTSIAKFYSNWDTGFYSASDYPKEYHFKIIGTTDGTNPGYAKFRYSKDNGMSYLPDELTTGTDFQSIDSGLEVRWALTAGSLAQLAINDEWKITCTPVNTLSISGDSQYKTFGRG